MQCDAKNGGGGKGKAYMFLVILLPYFFWALLGSSNAERGKEEGGDREGEGE